MKVGERVQSPAPKPVEGERPKALPAPRAEKAEKAEEPQPKKSGNVGRNVDVEA